MEKISIIVPCYNEEEAVPLFYREICRVFQEIPDIELELIFVNDGSRDGTLKVVKGNTWAYPGISGKKLVCMRG